MNLNITLTVKKELNFLQLLENSWAGARDHLKEIKEQGREDEAMAHIAEVFEGTTPDETEVNDYIWFCLADEMDLYHETEEGED